MHLGGDTLSKEPVTPQSGIYWFKHPLVFCLNLLLLLLLPRGDFSNFTLSYLLVGFFIQERAFFFFPSSTFIILFIYSHCVCVCVCTLILTVFSVLQFFIIIYFDVLSTPGWPVRVLQAGPVSFWQFLIIL